MRAAGMMAALAAATVGDESTYALRPMATLPPEISKWALNQPSRKFEVRSHRSTGDVKRRRKRAISKASRKRNRGR